VRSRSQTTVDSTRGGTDRGLGPLVDAMGQVISGGAIAGRFRRRDAVAFLAYLAIVLGTYVLGLGLGVLTGEGLTVYPLVWEPVLFPGLFVYVPPLVAVVTLRAGGSIPGSIAVGAVPGVAFIVLGVVAALLGTGQGDSPLWALSLTFGAIGLAGAVLATTISIVVDRLLRSRAPS